MLDKLNTLYRDTADEYYKKYRRFLPEESVMKILVLYILSAECNLWRLMDNLNNADFQKAGSLPNLEFN